MKISDIIANTIDKLPTDHVFSYTDFNMEASKKDAVVKALNRMVAAGKITKLSKGKFYKPRQSRFGALQPSAYQIAKDLLEQDSEIIGYITGYNAYNEMGLTTQIPATLQIGTNKYRRAITRGLYKISFIVQPNKITKTNIELLRILDAIRFIREIPGTTPDEACNRLMSILGQLSTEKVKTLATLVLKYNPAVQALCGAMLENIRADELLINKIAASLNPVTEYSMSVSESVLPNKKKWRLK
jgi:hypothetical protein